MAFIVGADRTEPMLLPAMVEDYVHDDAAVRVIDAFVASLDLHKLGFERALPKATGRPGYNPATLLKLYIYGYLNNLRSSRKLERACRINLEIIWLTCALRPDFKTIADFRADNPTGVSGACRSFVQFCRKMGLFTQAIATIDGTKLQAAASRRKVMTQEEVTAATIKLDAEIGAYLTEMDAADAAEGDDTSDRQTRPALKALEKLRTRRGELMELSDAMASDERALGVLGEAEARPMGSGKGAKPPSYNVQIAVDTATHMIVHHDVTTEATDNRLLYQTARQTKAVLGTATLQVIADGGYANASDAAKCEANGIMAAVPAPRPANKRGDFYTADAFKYDAETDTMTCPAGRKLLRNGGSNRDQERRYRAKDCSGCALKQYCTTADRRYVHRHVHHAALERMAQRVKDGDALMRLRRSTVEHPFATLKDDLGRRFLLRGTLKAGTETAFAVLGYNINRAISLFGCQALIEHLA